MTTRKTQVKQTTTTTIELTSQSHGASPTRPPCPQKALPKKANSQPKQNLKLAALKKMHAACKFLNEKSESKRGFALMLILLTAIEGSAVVLGFLVNPKYFALFALLIPASPIILKYNLLDPAKAGEPIHVKHEDLNTFFEKKIKKAEQKIAEVQKKSPPRGIEMHESAASQKSREELRASEALIEQILADDRAETIAEVQEAAEEAYAIAAVEALQIAEAAEQAEQEATFRQENPGTYVDMPKAPRYGSPTFTS